jgi:glyoxylase-like metal-dependent hydrolase (beta-lactamase superfamily II)
VHDIDLIVLTHLHPDQRRAAEALRNFCHAPIAASAGVEQLLAERRERKISVWLHDIEGLPDHPDWRVIACSGHTPGSLCLYNPFTRELLCGDTVSTVRGGVPLVRGSTNPAQFAETIRTLRSLPVSYLYPGHGRAILSHRPLSKLDVQW